MNRINVSKWYKSSNNMTIKLLRIIKRFNNKTEALKKKAERAASVCLQIRASCMGGSADSLGRNRSPRPWPFALIRRSAVACEAA
jgi:hypothetical protein